MSRRRWFGTFSASLLAVSLLASGASASAAAARTSGSASPTQFSPAAAAAPSVRLLVPDQTVKVVRFPGQPIYVDPGIALAAVRGTFQVNAWRSDYDHPVQAAQIINTGGTVTERALPDGLVTSMDGLNNFFHVIVRNKNAHIVSDEWMPFCPAGADQRTNDNGPANPTFPRNCFTGPFTLGAVFGIDRGWSVAALGYTGVQFDGKNGTYTLHIAIGKRYREFFGITDQDGMSTQTLDVRKDTSSCLPFCPRDTPVGPAGASSSRGLTPAVSTASPNPDTLPDLVALPGWSAAITTTDGHDYLEFAATIWDKGPAPLVVEGYRIGNEPKMKAWQYFYDAAGNVVGKARVGNFHYDKRPGHEHWHFEQFARYSLLDADQQQVVLSEKEAFCLAPTDAIDMTTPGALWNPQSTGLSTACGGPQAIWVREVLPTGWGDTYVQTLPGQSLDITNLPNGVYYLSVEANPDHVLYESNYGNNTELRRIHLTGRTGHRHLHVSPWHGIDI
jgi:Lysyl oxidase